jgi:GNAT superfamily N-acetyltransferase
MALTVVAIMATDTLDLRGRILRGGSDHGGFPDDDLPGTFHLGAQDGEAIVGVATFVPRGDGVWQLRGMAVEEDRQGEGIGTAILDEAASRLRRAGALLVWANGRDTALGFYERAGWEVVGEGYVLPVHDDRPGMPHHRVELRLSG